MRGRFIHDAASLLGETHDVQPDGTSFEQFAVLANVFRHDRIYLRGQTASSYGLIDDRDQTNAFRSSVDRRISGLWTYQVFFL